VGSGAAGVGIGRLLRTALLTEGLTPDEARQHLIFIDSTGLVWEGRAELEVHKREMALRKEDLAAVGLSTPPPDTLEKLIRDVRPSVLIGTTGQPGDFTPAAIRAMADNCERPIILPLSNPTSKAECTPSEALLHSDGRALVATGSPFDPVQFKGRKHVIGQCNNAFIFPGVGLGVLISEASRVTDSMFLAAARALAEFTVGHAASDTCLYPSLSELRKVSRIIAFQVARTARDEGFGHSLDDNALQAAIDEFFWAPNYPETDPAVHHHALAAEVPAHA
jgi:malate dehydrogenase (oxaloacetate-decarboxylating)